MTYKDGSDIGIVRPDFIFFARLPDGSIAADIVDPNGTQFSDALPKLKGLARYSEANHGMFRRIDCVAALEKSYRVLDLTEPRVGEAIHEASSAKALYESEFAADYLT